jgi:leucine dehydrogenase
MNQQGLQALSQPTATSGDHQDDLLAIASRYGCGEIHIKTDPDTGLLAIIAIHSTRLGPATGGCRCLPYPSFAAALEDAANLARGMSYKAALAGIPCGGGKSVLMRPETIADRCAYFESFGEFIETLGGRYVTAVDSGTGTADMDCIARHTGHARGLSPEYGGGGDPSPFTARGVRKAMEVAVNRVLGRSGLEGVHVAIQGAGHVGYALARELHALGARLTITDHNAANLERCHDEFGADTETLDGIFGVECDVFAPCALGGVINDQTIGRLRTAIIAGAANNQLADTSHGMQLHQKGIVYLPDYVINSGGLIHVLNLDPQVREQQLNSMLRTLRELFEQSGRSGIPMFRQADIMAERILGLVPEE